MDHTETLADDTLAGILVGLQSRDLAASRCVCRAWRAVVDDRRLLQPHLLPHSVEGIFANFANYHRPHFLARPSTQHPGVDYGNLHFLPCYTGDDYRRSTIADHCNGLLLHDSTWELSVVNPATRRWERLPAKPGYGERYTPYLAFDPTVSPPQYEVFLIPPKALGLFDLADCQPASVSPEQLVEANFTVSWSFFSEVAWRVEVSQHSTEWPPPVLALQVFSSTGTGQWQERSFVREGNAMARVVNVRTELWFMGRSITRWRYSAYCHGALHVLLCHGAFVTRFSLSNGKYQVIKTPTDAKENKVGEHYLGRSGMDVCFAKLHDRIRIWTLGESSGQLGWVLNKIIDLEPMEKISSLHPNLICKPWILDDNHVLDEYKNNKMLAGEAFDWNSADDNVLDTNGEYGRRRGLIQLLGFHPYKDIAFFLVESRVAVAYHLDSSKVQYVGHLHPKHNKFLLEVGESFLYTPCMIGDLPETANARR